MILILYPLGVFLILFFKIGVQYNVSVSISHRTRITGIEDDVQYK